MNADKARHVEHFAAQGQLLNRHRACAVIVANDRVFVVKERIKRYLVTPGLLDQLELLADRSVERKEMDAAQLPIVLQVKGDFAMLHILAREKVFAEGDGAADDTMAVARQDRLLDGFIDAAIARVG